jgi:hypothetical protein
VLKLAGLLGGLLPGWLWAIDVPGPAGDHRTSIRIDLRFGIPIVNRTNAT